MTAIDSNVIAAFWDVDPMFNAAARLLEDGSSRDRLMISAPVFAELLASPGRTKRVLDRISQGTEYHGGPDP
jgi:predicted nucleic acid-binding protein